jgi:hypothetical protein
VYGRGGRIPDVPRGGVARRAKSLPSPSGRRSPAQSTPVPSDRAPPFTGVLDTAPRPRAAGSGGGCVKYAGNVRGGPYPWPRPPQKPFCFRASSRTRTAASRDSVRPGQAGRGGLEHAMTSRNFVSRPAGANPARPGVSPPGSVASLATGAVTGQAPGPGRAKAARAELSFRRGPCLTRRRREACHWNS